MTSGVGRLVVFQCGLEAASGALPSADGAVDFSERSWPRRGEAKEFVRPRRRIVGSARSRALGEGFEELKDSSRRRRMGILTSTRPGAYPRGRAEARSRRCAAICGCSFPGRTSSRRGPRGGVVRAPSRACRAIGRPRRRRRSSGRGRGGGGKIFSRLPSVLPTSGRGSCRASRPGTPASPARHSTA